MVACVHRGRGGRGGMGPGRFLMFFFLLYCSFFVWPGNAHVFSVVAFVRPNSDICEPEPPKDFCDVIPFVLLITTEIKEESYRLSDSCTSSRAGVSRNMARVLIRFGP